MVILYSIKSGKIANGVWIIYNICRVKPSLSYLQMKGGSKIRATMDDFYTYVDITEVCYVILCRVNLNVLKYLCCYY